MGLLSYFEQFHFKMDLIGHRVFLMMCAPSWERNYLSILQNSKFMKYNLFINFLN